MKGTSAKITGLIVAFGLLSFPLLSLHAEQVVRIIDSEGNELQLVPLDDNSIVKLLSGTGDIEVQSSEFSCGDVSCDDVMISSSPTEGAEFTVDPTEVDPGDNISISWFFPGAWEFMPGGLPGTSWSDGVSRRAKGSEVVSTEGLSDGESHVIEFNDICNGPNCADPRTLSFSIREEGSEPEPEPAPEGCEDVPTLADVSDDWQLADDVVWDRDPNPNLYEEVFGRVFPGPPNGVDFYLDKGRYAAIQFTTPSDLNSRHEGRWSEESHFQLTLGTRWVSISRCPGNFDFNTFEQERCLRRWRRSESGVRWVGPGHDFAGTRCELEPDTTYYYNMLYSSDELDDFPPTQHDCQGDPQCGHITQSSHNYSFDD